jgi:hypothetical protein
MAGQQSRQETAMLDHDLDAAVTAGVIGREQAEALRAFQRRRQGAEHGAAAATVPLEADEEKFRILGGFNDILVAIGLFLLISALFSASAVVANGLAIAILSAAMAWVLAEVFTRRLRLALPSIILAVMFVASIAWSSIGISGTSDDPSARALTVVAAAGAVAAGLHYARFRLPIDVGLVACGLVSLVIALVLSASPDLGRHLIFAVTLAAGLAVFALAMRFDLADPLRLSRKADTAFWLHLVAAPLIVHSVVAGLFGGESLRGSVLFALFADGAGSLVHLEGSQLALAILAIVIVLFVVALVIDRRALLVSGLTYAGYSLWVLFRDLGGKGGVTLPATLFALALLVLGVSAGWSGLRAAIVPLVPLGRWRASLPPLRRRAALEEKS